MSDKELPVSIGALANAADSLASRLESDWYRFGILVIITVSSAVYYLSTSDSGIAIVMFAFGSMVLLFSLLAPDRRPAGWKAIWTFYLFACYFLFALTIVGFAFYKTGDDRDLSKWYEDNWHQAYAQISSRNAQKVERVTKRTSKSKIFQDIQSALKGDEDLRASVIAEATFLENWEKCRKNRCRMETYQKQFDDRIFDFWANYRCFIASLRGNGYPRDFGKLLHNRYETLKEVTISRGVVEKTSGRRIIGDALRVCNEVK